jgi:prepilin-type N-terminal cleavage/methylation domain-containing protein
MARPQTSPASNRRPASKNVQAFTLVELLVVVLIMAIAGAMIIPMMTGTGEMQALSAARMIATDIQYAQSYAITNQLDVTVQFNPGIDKYELSRYPKTGANDTLHHPMTGKDYIVDFHTQDGFDRLDLGSASFDVGNGNNDPNSVVFDELGSPSGGGSVTVLGGSQTYRIDVTSVTGTVSVVTP